MHQPSLEIPTSHLERARELEALQAISLHPPALPTVKYASITWWLDPLDITEKAWFFYGSLQYFWIAPNYSLDKPTANFSEIILEKKGIKCCFQLFIYSYFAFFSKANIIFPRCLLLNKVKNDTTLSKKILLDLLFIHHVMSLTHDPEGNN
jgi:hypothetical protein